MKVLLKITAVLLLVYFLYVLMFGAFVFAFHTPPTSDYLENNPIERFFGEEGEIGPDRVLLLESGEEAKNKRLDIILNASESIDISYYSFHDGLATDIFTASLLEAANRGVMVRILLDGVANFMRDDLKESIYVFTEHPNMEFKYYEPINGLKPWTWNNRLHDKLLIVDRKWAIVGGRNIGDKYFDMGDEERFSHDRDVLVINTRGAGSESAVFQMGEYYEYLWNKFTKHPLTKNTSTQKRIANERTTYLIENLENYKNEYPEIYVSSLEWMDDAIKTSKVTFIHNPLTRFNKEPWVWYEITRLMDAAQSVFIQSPYVIPNRRMQGYMDIESIKDTEITVLTNSFASNPNTFGLAGHMKFRKEVIDFTDQVFEYQGIGSLHAKSFMFDDRISMIGTFNTDPRSAFLSTESMVVIDSEEFAEAFVEAIDDLLGQSLLVEEDYTYAYSSDIEELESGWGKRIKMRIIFMLTYFLDYLL